MGFNPAGGNISGADDVALSNPLNSQVLAYDSTVQKWKNTAATAGVPTKPWLVVSGNKIYEGAGGPRYRATGFNNYVMSPAGGTPAQTMSTTQIDDFFSRLRPNSLVRVWAFPPLDATYTWSQRLAQLDVIVAGARAYSHRLIFTLTDWHGKANDAYGVKTSSWITSQQYLASVYGANSYEDWAKTVAGRYANEPTVAIYDLVNEPSDDGTNTAAYATFATTAAGWVKANSPNALVYAGVQFPSALNGGSFSDTTAYQSFFANLDFCSAHDYETTGYITKVRLALTAARAIGKPLIIDEFGVWAKNLYGSWTDTDKDTNGLPAVNWRAQQKMVESFVQAALSVDDIFATLLWSAMDTDASWYVGAGMYEPLNQSGTWRTVRTVELTGVDFTDDSIASPEGWIESSFSLRYKPGTQIGGANSGATVSHLIYDRIGPSNYRQTTQANAPIAAQGALPGGWPSLQFSGTHSIPTATWFAGGTAGARQQHAIFAVFYPTALPGAGTYAYLVAPLTATTSFALRITSTGLIEMVAYGTSATSGATICGTTTTPLAVNTFHFLEARWNASSGSFAIKLDGNLEASGSLIVSLAANNLRIGAAHDNTNGFIGHLAEIIKQGVYTSPQDQSKIYAYLTSKYGLPG